MKRLFSIILIAVLFSFGQAAEVEIRQKANGDFELIRRGEPFKIKGVGGNAQLTEAGKYGANSVRTWGVDTLEKVIDGERFIDRCERLGLTVTPGIWIAHARHGFDYSDPEQLEDQRHMVRQVVRTYKDHPAILMWGLGNEAEGPTTDGDDPRIWREMEMLAKIIKEEDSDHPVMTVIAGASEKRVKAVIEHYPSIDVLGVNAYAAAGSVAARIKKAGWKKPFVLAEFGPTGDWEVQKTPWGAPIEPNSRSKAEKYQSTMTLTDQAAHDICLGTYCFFWGQKQETTSTWYGMFLPTGEKLPQVDVMCRHWTGEFPEDRCPMVSQIESGLKNAVVPPDREFTVKIEASDPENDQLTASFTVTAESTDIRVGGERESVPQSFPDCTLEVDGLTAKIRTPAQPGNYRVFMVVKDGRGSACSDNFCFRVE